LYGGGDRNDETTADLVEFAGLIEGENSDGFSAPPVDSSKAALGQ
jgi:hypothetical protein